MEREVHQFRAGKANIEIRPLQASDSLEEMTYLLNHAYKQLAVMGLRYTATYQDIEITARRIKDALCLVGIKEGKMVANIAYYSAEKTGIQQKLYC